MKSGISGLIHWRINSLKDIGNSDAEATAGKHYMDLVIAGCDLYGVVIIAVYGD